MIGLIKDILDNNVDVKEYVQKMLTCPTQPDASGMLFVYIKWSCLKQSSFLNVTETSAI